MLILWFQLMVTFYDKGFIFYFLFYIFMISLIIRFSSVSEPCAVPSQNLGFENLVSDKYATLFLYRHCSLGVALSFFFFFTQI